MTKVIVPANRLRISDANVRKDNADLNIAELAANMAAIGQIHDLTVVALKKPKGHYAVVGGGRRYRAICHNIETGLWPSDHPVKCEERAATDNLTEVSFAENYQREPMTPADEIVTFGKMHAEDGMSADDIAARFGLTRRVVDARLKLTNLVPEIIDALRKGTITLDKAAAYAQASSHEEQQELFARTRTWSADQIHRHILNDTIESTHPIARFVGQDAYVAAGGTISLDMLNPDRDVWNDAAIAAQLATDKLNATAAELATQQALGWVRPVMRTYVSYEETQQFTRIHLPRRTLNEAEQAEAEKLSDDIEALNETIQTTEDPQEVETLTKKIDELSDAYDAIVDRPATLTPETTQRLGCFLTLKEDGSAALDTTLYSETPGRITSDGEFVEHSSSTTTGKGRGRTGEGDSATTPDLSARLGEELKLQRRDILAAHLASNPDIALDYMLFTLAESRMSYYSSESGTTLTASKPNDGQGDYPKGAANDHLAAVFEHLDKSWFESGSKAARFDAFAALDHQIKIEWAAYVMATSLIGIAQYGNTTDFTIQAHLARRMDIDFAAMWRPTAANYFDRIKKDLTLDALGKVGGDVFKARYATAKKRDLAVTAEKIFSGDAIIEPEIKDAALKWMPDALTFATVDPDRVEPLRTKRNAADNGYEVEDNQTDAHDVIDDDLENVDDDLETMTD